MALPLISKFLSQLGGIYAQWRGAKYVAETLTEEEGAGFGAVRTDMAGSTAIQWIEYNAITKRLVVRFRNRPRYPAYVYTNVPRLVWLGWLRAGSKGVYYHRSVKQHSDIIR